MSMARPESTTLPCGSSAIARSSRAITGEAPNPLASVVDDHIALPGRSSNVQEAQLIAVHLICRAFDLRVREIDAAAARPLAAVAK